MTNLKVTDKHVTEIKRGLLILEDSLVLLRDELLEKQDNYLENSDLDDFNFEDGVELKSTRESLDAIYDLYKLLSEEIN